MLRHAQSLKVTDPADLVYASQNLAIDYDHDGSLPDYEAGIVTTYTHIARVLVFKCNSLQLLLQAKLPQSPDLTSQRFTIMGTKLESARKCRLFPGRLLRCG